MEMSLSVLFLALLIDRLVGDPPFLWNRLPHPVVGFGKAIEIFDRRWNDFGNAPAQARRLGMIAIGLLVGLAALAGLLINLLLLPLGLVGWVCEAALASIFLAQKSLLDHVGDVAEALVDDGLLQARQAVAKIVGRETLALDGEGVSRAAIETTAEGFADGLVAPAFWFAVAGLPGLLAYKMINTADSMIGHRSPRYLHFGRAAARLDDLANFLPARLTAVLIAAGAWIAEGRSAARNALRLAQTDRGLHRSPNAGWPEAAIAGALDLTLGGPRRYGDLIVTEAHLNAAGRSRATPADIRAAMRIVDAGWAVLAVCVLGAMILLL